MLVTARSDDESYHCDAKHFWYQLHSECHLAPTRLIVGNGRVTLLLPSSLSEANEVSIKHATYSNIHYEK